MTWRVQNGLRSGIYGGWISKPGKDVTTALPGDFLLDTSSQVFQTVAQGDTAILATNNASTPPGSYSTTVSLPSAFASYSNLQMQAIYYATNSAGSVFSYQSISQASYLKYHISSGILTLTVVALFDLGHNGINPSTWPTYRAKWNVYRATF